MMQKMYKCLNCYNFFDTPEVKKPDAGHVLTPYDFRSDRVEPIRFCPVCMTTNIEKMPGTGINTTSKQILDVEKC